MTTIGYHKLYTLSPDNDLVEQEPPESLPAGSVAEQVEQLEREHKALNERLGASDVLESIRHAPATQAGIYPLRVTRFECLSEKDDGDEMCRQITARLGNLKVIHEVPFMRRGNVVFAIGTQGLVDPATQAIGAVDAILGCRVLWKGVLTPERYAYDLIMFKSGKDKSIARMTESIDLTHRLAEIDPALYQAEIAFHLDRESNDESGWPMLARVQADFASEDDLDRVAACYVASSDFSRAARGGPGDLRQLAEKARVACMPVPRKRYYQAYDAYLQDIHYAPR